MQDVNPQNVLFFLISFSFQQEEELRKSGEAKYGHLSNDLHVLIEVFAPPGEAYSRMSSALDEIKKFLVPVSLIRRVFSCQKDPLARFHFQSVWVAWFYLNHVFHSHCFVAHC